MRRLYRIMNLHREMNWSQIAREALRKKMRQAGLLKGIVEAKGLTVREALKLDSAVKREVMKK